MSQREVPDEEHQTYSRIPRVIVHFMDDDERALACQLMPTAHFAESFCAGEVSSTHLAKLQEAGLVVMLLPQSTSIGEQQGLRNGAGEITSTAQIYLLTTHGLLLGDGHRVLEHHGVKVLERCTGSAYRVQMGHSAAASVRALNFVQSLSAGSR
jgi:hypothetical protein